MQLIQSVVMIIYWHLRLGKNELYFNNFNAKLMIIILTLCP
jgi:hypothetical protein